MGKLTNSSMMKLRRIHKDNLQDLSQIVNTFYGCVLLGFGKEKGFFETTGCFISYDDKGKGEFLEHPLEILFMPRRAGHRSEWFPITKLIDESDGDEYYWTTYEEYDEWKEENLRKLKNDQNEK